METAAHVRFSAVLSTLPDVVESVNDGFASDAEIISAVFKPILILLQGLLTP